MVLPVFFVPECGNVLPLGVTSVSKVASTHRRTKFHGSMPVIPDFSDFVDFNQSVSVVARFLHKYMVPVCGESQTQSGVSKVLRVPD